MARKKNNDDIERRRMQKKLSMRRAREKLKANPEMHEAAKKRERERWHKRKEEGKVLSISQLSEREKRKKRKTWRSWAKTHSRKYKNRKEAECFVEANTPPTTPTQNGTTQPIPSTSRVESGKRTARRNRESARKEMKGYEEKCKQLERRLNKYKKRLQRLKIKQSGQNLNTKNTPRKAIDQLLKNSEKNKIVIRKKLVFGEVLKRQVTDNVKKIKSKKVKKQVVSLLSGHLVSKYRLLTDIRSMTLSKIKRYQGYYGQKIIEREIKRARTAVTDFLEKDKNSRLCPGKRDTITRRKIKKQKRYLNDTMKNLHKEFVKVGTNFKKMSYTTFCRLRPFWIVKPAVKDLDTCLCKVHENMKLIVNKLKVLKMISENSPTEVIKNVCCSEDLPERCLERTCILCRSKKLLFITESHDLEEKVTYFQWVIKRVPVVTLKGEEKIVQKTIKEEINCSKKELISALENILSRYMNHIANIHHQYRVLDAIKKTLQVGSGFLHMDFSENYQCKYSSEIQSAHFGGSKAQITIHTSVFYFRDSNTSELKHIPFATLTENCRHDAVAVVAHLVPVFNEIKRLVPNLDSIHFLSDGAGTQYKNKLLFQLFGSFVPTKLKPKTMMWHYTESGHGKGAPDGVGGLLKRTADAIVARGTDICDVAILESKLKENCPGVTLLPFNVNVLQEIEKILPKHVETFKGTTKIHQLIWTYNTTHLIARRLSCIACEADQDCPHYGLGKIKLLNSTATCLTRLRYSDVYTDDSDEEPLKVKVNDYVITKLTGNKSVHHYVGVVTKKFSDELLVKFMKRSASNKFVFPETDDISLIELPDILTVLDQPIVNNRQQYQFLIDEKFMKMLE